MKMADIDTDLFGDHDKMNAQPYKTGETIPFTTGGVIERGSTWEPEQEISFGGTSLRAKVLRKHVEVLYRTLCEEMGQTPEAFHFDDF